MRTISHRNLWITIFDSGKFLLSPRGCAPPREPPAPETANFELSVAGAPPLALGADGLLFQGLREHEGGVTLDFLCREPALRVETELDFTPGADVVSQRNTVISLAPEPVTLTAFSSLFLDGVASGAGRPWYENESLRFWVCHSKWQGEGQWQSYTARQLGLYPTTMHAQERASHKIQSVGSWSTANYYPMTVLEDPASGSVWYAETEGSHTWHLKWYAFGGYPGGRLCLEASGCDEKSGWFLRLRPGERYAAERAFFGVTPGAFAEAAAQMNAFKRHDSLVRQLPPLVYNDYMGGLWLDQRPGALTPLIRRAARLGCEVFCIDAGWQVNAEQAQSGDRLGDWLPDPALYTERTLREVAQEIRGAGMLPGIWLELESCDASARGASLTDDAVLKRHGVPVGGAKWFYNFDEPAVCEYLTRRIADLYEMGFRYIKNDYNHSLGAGCTNNGADGSPAQGMIRSNDSFLRFLDALRVRFPDLIIENCGSGGLREDNKMLRHFALQSTSDQELYQNTPSILMGSAALMPPEKAGVWVCPYPTTFYNFRDFRPDAAFLDAMRDGRQTAFGIVSGLMGTMYLSGRIDLADEHNFGLLQQGAALWRSLRATIARSRPVYPLGMCGINERRVTALGLLADGTLLLAVWNLTNAAQTAEIPLGHWLTRGGTISRVFPQTTQTGFALKQAALHVVFSRGLDALFFEISF